MAPGDPAPADPAPADPRPRAAPPIWDEQSRQSMRRLGGLIDTATPWLLDIGSWVFGGLLAFCLLMVTSLVNTGPAGDAVLVSTVALACALPLNVAGILLLRLVKDMKDAAVEELTLKAFRDADFPDVDAYFPPAEQRRSLRRRRASAALGFSAVVLALSIALTFTGLVAALWYMAWWIGVALLVMVAVSIAAVLVAFVRSLPPETEAERELKRRYAEWRAQKETRERRSQWGR